MIRDHRLPPEAFHSIDEVSIDAVYPPPYNHILRQQGGGQCSSSERRRALKSSCRPLGQEIHATHSSALVSSIGIEYSTVLLSRSVDSLGLRNEEAGALVRAIAEAITQAGGPPTGAHAVQAAIAAAAVRMGVPADEVADVPTGVSFEAISGAAVSAVTHNEDPKPALHKLFRFAGMEASPEDLENITEQINKAKSSNGNSSEPERSWNAAHDFFWEKMTQTSTGRAQLAVTIAQQTARLAAYTRKLHSELAYLGWYKMLSRPASESTQAYIRGPPPPVHPPPQAWKGTLIERSSYELRAAYNYEKQGDLDINIHEGDILTNCTSDRSGWVHGTVLRGNTGYFPYNRLGSVKRYSEHPEEPKKLGSASTNKDIMGLHNRAQDQPLAHTEVDCTEVIIHGNEVDQCDLWQAIKALHEAIDQNFESADELSGQQAYVLRQAFLYGIQELNGMPSEVIAQLER
ncbi:actin binding protein [Gnomoniopsis smithogilvyi]|uniref:Actin binding protein n=1 Tax=Gnomoniopsis smithogilvyi TaxID=1191159 RepID=A0A9W8YV22_9PEZI|nr:actin binding protein [Gnomoniopsis smithogilvyi]